MADANNELWRPYIPQYVSLYNIDYRDTLSENPKLHADCVRKNDLFPLTENIYDWWDYPEGYYIDEMKREMERDGIEFDSDWIDEIREVLWNIDDSNPVDDLLRNTGNINLYYDLCHWWGNAWCTSEEDTEEVLNEMCDALQIPRNDERRRKLLYDIFANCGEGGALRIYFKCPLKTVISGDPYADNDSKDDFKAIRFKGSYTVSLHDQINGGGWSEEIELDCEFEFNRDNLQSADYGDRYTWRDVYGCDPDGDAPIMLMEATQNAKQVKKSCANENIAQEEEYERVFKAGGCTFGDMKFDRHRDVYYRNDYPCGNKCPHCGTFWID